MVNKSKHSQTRGVGMKEYIVKRYKCDFCRKSGSSKVSIGRHESECFSDPSKQACKTCFYHYCDEDGHGCRLENDMKLDHYFMPTVTQCAGWEQV